MADPTHSAAPLPPGDRPTRMRWGFLLTLLLGGALLLGIALSLFKSAHINLPSDGAALHASGIFKAMMLYAQDHDGRFPTAPTNANQAFRQLFPDYMEDERSFFVPNSAWHNAAPDKRPDGDLGIAPDYSKCLERGENHWAYVSGLDTSSPAELPVIADGFVENQAGTYTDHRSMKGGVWTGTRAIVVFADGSAKKLPLSPKTHFRVLRSDPTKGRPVDIFTREGGLPESARVLNPE